MTGVYDRFVAIQDIMNWDDRMDALLELMQEIGASAYIEVARGYYRW